MTPAEVQELLEEASAYDGRQVNDQIVMAWTGLLRDLRADQAMQAMRNHFSTEDRKLMPVHIVQGVKKLRAELMGNYQGPGLPKEVPLADPDDVMAYLVSGLTQRAVAGDGLPSSEVPQLVGRVGQMPAEFRRTTPMVVPCRECKALVGRSCRTKTGNLRVAHLERVQDFDVWRLEHGRSA